MPVPEINTSVTEDMYVGYTPDRVHHNVKPICAIIDGEALCAENNLLRTFKFHRPFINKPRPLRSTFDIPGWCFGRDVVWTDSEDGSEATVKLSKIISDIVVEVIANETHKYQFTLEDLCWYKAHANAKINGINLEFKFYNEEKR